ncbi:MAG: branched-chain amino acid ABC transporter permease [Anaerolineae bacterium]|nr:branched-chain amino acid ABC transporter permease [Anaerolineae bacterium]MDQ7034734.1 branched-chain amino acid ABC transporter permease [Anaerolineae bacterium]
MAATQKIKPNRLATIPEWVWGLIVIVVLLSLHFVLSEFQKTVASEMLIMGLFALSLNLIMGYGGMVHFGHAAFYGVGGYTVAILLTQTDINPWLAMLIAPFVSAFAAFIIGWFCVRRVGLYFSILTLAFAQLVYIFAFNSRELTGGDDGLQGLKFPTLIDDTGEFYLFTVLVFIVCYLLVRMIVHSPFVQVLKAIRENSERAQFLGVNVRRHQLATFVMGGFFAGVAGMLLVAKQHFIGVEMLFWTTSAEPILASLLGGMYTLAGPIIGGAILVFLEMTLNRLVILEGIQWQGVLGVLTVIIVLAAPTGLFGLVQRLLGLSQDES